MSSQHVYSLKPFAPRQYRFGAFTLDLDAGFLRRDTTEVALRPKAFELLTYLVERHGRLVGKGELIDALWPDASVTENSLSQCLLEVRRALGDESQQMIRTVARRGYLFAAPVAAPDTNVHPDRILQQIVPPPPRTAPRIALTVKYAALLLIAGVLVVSALVFRPDGPNRISYVPLTNFTDSATNPAVSPDGQTIAFIRGSKTFLDPGQIYVKRLPDGEPVPLTNNTRLKMAPAFSGDGSHIAFTATGNGGGAWETWTVPVLGGEPRQLFANAAALTWIGDGRILFSEIKRGVQMGVVTANINRSEARDVYLPPGMAHRSSASPDRRSVLIASEMNSYGWLPCRVAPIDGNGPGKIVGPNAKCTHAVWSPDGRYMYFSAESDGGFHTWRQAFPDGQPEQITFGAGDEEGIAMWPDGRSFASSVGTTVSSIWLHDAGRDRQITSEGFGQLPSFSRDAKRLYYLLKVFDGSNWAAGELWAVDLATDKRRRLLQGVSMAHYDISDDGSRVVFARTDRGSEGIWMARVDDALPPVRLTSEADTRAVFGPAGTVIAEGRESGGRYLFSMREDGTDRQKLFADRINSMKAISPDRQWVVAWVAGDDLHRLVAYPVQGGSAVPICEGCGDADGGPLRGRTPQAVLWSSSGEYVFLRLQWPSEPLYESGKTYVLRLDQPNSLPPFFTSEADVARIPGVQVMPHGGIFPGPTPSLYAYTRAATHRNIYRIYVR